MTITLNINLSPELSRSFGDLQKNIGILIQGQTHMATALDDLKAQVAANTAVEKSALILIQGFQARLDAAIAAGPEALNALSAELKTSDDELAAAVTANTPAAVVPDPAQPAGPAPTV